MSYTCTCSLECRTYAGYTEAVLRYGTFS